MDMLRVGRETPTLDPGVDGDLVHLGAVDPHEPRLRPDPEGTANKLGRHGIVRAAELDVAVTLDQTAALLETREEHGRQGPERRLLRGHEELKHLLAHGAVDAGVGDRALPLGQKLVLLGKAREGPALEGVILDVLDARLDLALMPGHGGLGRGEDRPVMAAELDQLGIEIRVEPVGLEHGGLQIIDDRARRHAAKMPERVFQAPDEGLGRLPPDHLGVALARMAEDGAEQMRPSPVVVLDHPSACPEVDLHLLARGTLHPPEWQVTLGGVAPDEPLNRLVAALEAVVADQVMVDPHGRETPAHGILDHRAPRLAAAPTPLGPGGHYGWF